MGPITSTVPTTASRQNAMKALEAVIIRKQTLAGKSADDGKLLRFGYGSKTVEGITALRSRPPRMNRRGPVGVI
nr:hypothetical protein XF14B_03620 [Bradyrhizobium diazoefficiens]